MQKPAIAPAPLGGLDRQFADAMGQLVGPDFPQAIGLAVSGGGDSMAMLTLAHNWTRAWGVKLWVVTIDHGLREASADEADMVARTCADLGWPHATLRWHWDGQGNVMDAARRARLDLINQWRGDLRHVMMAHTRDDVAETFLMRLKRGSGVDGLAAMQSTRRIVLDTPSDPLDYDGTLPTGTLHPDGFDVIRPCLDMSRDALRHYLRVLKGDWVDDPSNENDAYDRARIRKLLPLLEAEGLGVDVLAGTANRLSRARQSLQASTRAAANSFARLDASSGDVLIERDGFAALDIEIQLRLLAAGLQTVSGASYRPRLRPLEDMLDRLLSGGGATLSGCEARASGDHIRIWREWRAVQDLDIAALDGAVWDGRWQAIGLFPQGARLRGLGAGGVGSSVKIGTCGPPRCTPSYQRTQPAGGLAGRSVAGLSVAGAGSGPWVRGG